MTGYSLAALRGENLRLLQGTATDPESVATLQEGIDIWEQRTVELWNYRADGTRFRNRVTIVPLTGPTAHHELARCAGGHRHARQLTAGGTTLVTGYVCSTDN
ncbi:hypothetical protein [Haloarcula sp. CBA1127]|uniref:hypothetical protein n=1 Tax=Haloarcula sp. CBA1127 TaxID=1765055 RepID=UPI000ABCAB8F|nr:hypothetical protein [Haloarcula sp. CBA1127]